MQPGHTHTHRKQTNVNPLFLLARYFGQLNILILAFNRIKSFSVAKRSFCTRTAQEAMENYTISILSSR